MPRRLEPAPTGRIFDAPQSCVRVKVAPAADYSSAEAAGAIFFPLYVLFLHLQSQALAIEHESYAIDHFLLCSKQADNGAPVLFSQTGAKLKHLFHRSECQQHAFPPIKLASER
jgi:hypothetical protein